MIRFTVMSFAAMLLMAPVTADAKCWSWQSDSSDGGGSSWSWQKPKPATSWAITNEPRQRVGDIYNPGTGRLRIRLTVAKGDRNNQRQIIGYIERDGTVTNTHRQPVADIELD